MTWWEILIVIAAAAFVAIVIAVSLYRRSQGKSSCDCGGNCEGCAGCSARARKPRDKK